MSTPGRVVRMRLSPRDCIRVVDALVKLGIDPHQFNGALSFSYAAKRVFESCLFTLERDAVIPERTGFEFLEMMSPFPTDDEAKKARSTQIAFTKLGQSEHREPEPIVQEDYDKACRRRRYKELMFKQQNDSENMQDDEMSELVRLMPEFQLSTTEVQQGRQG